MRYYVDNRGHIMVCAGPFEIEWDRETAIPRPDFEVRREALWGAFRLGDHWRTLTHSRLFQIFKSDFTRAGLRPGKPQPPEAKTKIG